MPATVGLVVTTSVSWLSRIEAASGGFIFIDRSDLPLHGRDVRDQA